MKLSTLIASAAKTIFDRDPSRLGIRLSPVQLSNAELIETTHELRKLLGKTVYIVGSSPGTKEEQQERLYLAPDQRAAERATAWRNEIDVKAKSHLVYISVDEHAKASGLKDCLVQLREQDLIDAFLAWCDSKESGMPPEFASSVRESGLGGQVRVAAFCKLAREVKTANVSGTKAWSVVGQNLPLIGLAKDTALSKDDARARLQTNADIVRRAIAGEDRKRSSQAALSKLEGQMSESLAGTAGDSRQQALSSIDLKDVKTEALTPTKKNKPKANATKPSQPPKQEKKTSPKTEPPKKAETSKGEQAKKNELPQTEKTQDNKEAPPAPRGPAKIKPPQLAPGLRQLLDALLQGSGEPVELEIRENARAILREIPKTIAATTRACKLLRSSLAGDWSSWVDARRKLVDIASRGREHTSVGELFAGSIPQLHEDEAFKTALEIFLNRTIALYSAAIQKDEIVKNEVLCLDSCAVRDSRGVLLRLLGPLHLLALGSTMARLRDSTNTKLAEPARALYEKLRNASPTSPDDFPEAGGGRLMLSKPESGLIVFERRPELLSEASLREAGEALMARYLALCPYALLGCRVAIQGDIDAGPLLEALALAASKEERLESLEVLCSFPPTLDNRHSPAKGLLASGKLKIGPFPSQEDLSGARAPHILFHLVSAPPIPSDEEASAPVVQTASLPGEERRITFELRRHALQIKTSLEGFPEFEAFEALFSSAQQKAPQKSFIRRSAGISLRAEIQKVQVPDATWQAVIAPNIGRYTPMGTHLLMHERLKDAACAVTSKKVQPATRAVQEGLKYINLDEKRPRQLETIASKLAASSRAGLITLYRESAQLVTAGILSAAMLRHFGTSQPIIASLDGGPALSLLGEDNTSNSEVMLLGVSITKEQGLEFLLGCASLSNEEIMPPPRLERAANILQLAASDKNGSNTAREALSWILWAVLAADERLPPELEQLLRDWNANTKTTIKVLCILPSNPQFTKTKSLKLGKINGELLPLEGNLINRLLLH